jgi:hypothetical protein
MIKMAQKNMYELTHSDGKVIKVVANSYRDVQRAVKTFNVDAIKMQRIYKDGKRGKAHTI